MEGQTAATGDAQSPTAPVGQDYGERAAQMDAQGIIPVAGSPQGSFSRARPLSEGNLPAPGTIPSLSDPSAYPEEALTAGLTVGPGPGPEAMMTQMPTNPSLDELREVHRRRPNERIRRLIQYAENHG